MFCWHWEGPDDGFRIDSPRGLLNSWAFGYQESVLLGLFEEKWKFFTIEHLSGSQFS